MLQNYHSILHLRMSRICLHKWLKPILQRSQNIRIHRHCCLRQHPIIHRQLSRKYPHKLLNPMIHQLGIRKQGQLHPMFHRQGCHISLHIRWHHQNCLDRPQHPRVDRNRHTYHKHLSRYPRILDQRIQRLRIHQLPRQQLNRSRRLRHSRTPCWQHPMYCCLQLCMSLCKYMCSLYYHSSQ